jgi:GTPase SAR1 family protein
MGIWKYLRCLCNPSGVKCDCYLCMYVFKCRTLLENCDWLEEQLGDVDDDYLLFDCPGQIELYTHLPVMRKLVDMLQKWNFRICVVFMIDSQFMVDGAKFLSGIYNCTSLVCIEYSQLCSIDNSMLHYTLAVRYR